MEPADKELLIHWRPELVEQIDIVNGLLTHLQSRKVLNPRMVQNITYNKPPDRQVEELLDLLPKRGPNAFKLFCDALIATDQEDVVTNFLCKKSMLESTLEASFVSDTSVPASPLSSAVAEEYKGSATASVSEPSVALPSQKSVSILSKTAAIVPSSPEPILFKRKTECDRTAVENDDKGFVAGPSETDSSPLKRARPEAMVLPTDGQSVICIGDSDNVIKIYSSPALEKGEKSQHVYRSSGMIAQETSAAQILGSYAHNSPSAGSEPKRYVLKHFLVNDSTVVHGHKANINLAEKFVSDLPQQYLDLLHSHSKSPNKVSTIEFGSSDDLLRERLTRCDSTDTMDPERTENLCVDSSRRGADSDQPDQSTFRFPSGGPVVLVPPAPVKMADYMDGPIQVHVEKCTRLFYLNNKDKSYQMVHLPRGQALIINVNEVAGKPPRRGTDIDRDNLANLLNQFHFQVTVYNDNDDLTAQGMVDKLNEFVRRKEHATADACIICLLSHGEEGYMFGTDGKKIPLDEIFTLFDNRHCTSLLNKPKIFFIQACRGGLLDHGVKVPQDEHDGGQPINNNNVVQHPSMSDMLICYPTLQGYYAWRNRERGSWYIEAVVKIFMKYAKEEDVCAMLNRVNSDVSRKVSRTPQMEMDRMSQMSEYKSSLRKPYLYFFPGIGAPTKD